MKENEIRKRAKDALQKEGYVVWCPPKVMYAETDIFGIGDGIAWRGAVQRLIQWTTLSNKSARKNKIQTFLQTNNLIGGCELWCWDDKGREFRKFNVIANDIWEI
jgi:hypothetical protein